MFIIKNLKATTATLLALPLIMGGTAFPALGQQIYKPAHLADKVTINSQLTFQHTLTDNRDLRTASTQSAQSFSVQPRIRALVDFNDDIRGYADVRALLIDAEDGAGAEDDSGIVSDFGENFVELRQLWLSYDNILGHPPLKVQVGRQRLSERRTNWWNRNFDAARIHYDSTLFKSFIGIGENLFAYRTNDSDFKNDDEDRLRIFAEASWRYKPKHSFDLRFLQEIDHSTNEPVGTVVPTNDRDLEDFELLWAGARFTGDISPAPSAIEKLDYHVDIMGVGGQEKVYTTVAGATSATRVVSAVNERDVLAWAFDGNVNMKLNAPLNPVLTLGYAFGSGDSNPNTGTNNTFRQTGLQGNSSRLGLSSGSVRNFGEVLRPELSNLHIYTLGAGVPVSKSSDLSAFYHYYHLDKPTTDLRNDSISAPLNNTDKSLGHGIDLVYNINISDTMGWTKTPMGDTRLKLNFSGYRGGKAYGTADGETSIRTFAELQVRF